MLFILQLEWWPLGVRPTNREPWECGKLHAPSLRYALKLGIAGRRESPRNRRRGNFECPHYKQWEGGKAQRGVVSLLGPESHGTIEDREFRRCSWWPMHWGKIREMCKEGCCWTQTRKLLSRNASLIDLNVAIYCEDGRNPSSGHSVCGRWKRLVHDSRLQGFQASVHWKRLGKWMRGVDGFWSKNGLRRGLEATLWTRLRILESESLNCWWPWLRLLSVGVVWFSGLQ